MPEVKATHRYMRMSPYKVREVLDLVRGLHVDEARELLRFHPRRAAQHILKVLDSAVANADHNHDLPADELYISKAFADEGITLRRWRPRARGRATRIRKRTTHLTVIVDRMTEEQLASRLQRSERRTSSRAARVAASRRAQQQRAETEAPTGEAEEAPTGEAEEPTETEAPTGEAEEPTADAEPTEAETEAEEPAAEASETDDASTEAEGEER